MLSNAIFIRDCFGYIIQRSNPRGQRSARVPSRGEVNWSCLRGLDCHHADMNPEFTSQEQRMIERLRKQERRWPRLRWVLLAVGVLAIVNVALWGYLLSLLLHGWSSGKADYDMLIGVAIVFPKLLIHVAVATWAFSVVIRDWHGNVTRMLLLRLLDAQNCPSQASKIM